MESHSWVFDLECDALLNDATTLHCGVFQNTSTDEVVKFTPKNITEMFQFMDSCDTLIGHNVINFDFPVLEKLHNYQYSGTKIDTFVLSCLGNPDRSGGHSVENWARLLKLDQQKVEHEDWSRYTPEMLHRCTTDVVIQKEIYLSLLNELKPNEVTGVDYTRSWQLDHDFQSIFSEQERTGAPFNKAQAIEYEKVLVSLLDDIEDTVNDALGLTVVKGPQINSIFLKSGEYLSHIKKWFDSDFLKQDKPVAGAFCKVEFKQVTPGMYGAVKARYQELGWVASEFTPTGSPKLPSADELEAFANKINVPELIEIAKYGSISNRKGIIGNWIKSCVNGRLPAGGFSNGTNTARVRHTVVVNVPKVSADNETHELLWFPNPQPVFFGTEMRSLFWNDNDPRLKIVGSDAAGLELRCLAHYMNDEEFTRVLLSGDIHQLFWEKAGGVEYVASRNDMKNVTYAWLYGAGDYKLGTLCTSKKGTNYAAYGKAVKKNLLTGLPKLGTLVKATIVASKRGYLRGLDGRKIHMRRFNGRVSTNKALNTLLQSTGAIIIKDWTVRADKRIKDEKLKSKQIIHMHDEIQRLTYATDCDRVCEILSETIIESGKSFDFNIPLAADCKVGVTWAQTH